MKLYSNLSDFQSLQTKQKKKICSLLIIILITLLILQNKNSIQKYRKYDWNSIDTVILFIKLLRLRMVKIILKYIR